MFNFGLSCDVIGDLEVDKIRYRSTNVAGILNTVLILKIDPGVSEVCLPPPSPPPSQSRYGKITQSFVG